MWNISTISVAWQNAKFNLGLPWQKSIEQEEDITRKLDLNLRKKIMTCYIWSTVQAQDRALWRTRFETGCHLSIDNGMNDRPKDKQNLFVIRSFPLNLLLEATPHLRISLLLTLASSALFHIGFRNAVRNLAITISPLYKINQHYWYLFWASWIHYTPTCHLL
jgi:hypothetical protein